MNDVQIEHQYAVAFSKVNLLCGLQNSQMGIYVHVPFCPHICPYCDFVKTSRFSKKGTNSFFEFLLKQYRDLRSDYVTFAQMQHKRNKAGLVALESAAKPSTTVYFGGGTPGIFSGDSFKPLLSEIEKDFAIEECTVETNPYTHKTDSQNQLNSYAAVGIDRITLGAQTLCENALVFLGRKHTPAQVLNSIQMAQQSGIKKIQVDLIYGLPAGKRMLSVSDEICKLVDAGATGISTYALSVEPRTIFGKGNFAVHEMEETAVREYEEILVACARAGLKQVESSNFSAAETKHNNIYWYGAPYLGLGTGAHGLLPPNNARPFGRRYRVGKIPKEISAGNDNLNFDSLSDAEELFNLEYEPLRTLNDLRAELLFTLLRTPDGLKQNWLETFFEEAKIVKLKTDPIIARAVAENRVIFDSTGIKLAAVEKIRGDSWTERFYRILCD